MGIKKRGAAETTPPTPIYKVMFQSHLSVSRRVPGEVIHHERHGFRLDAERSIVRLREEVKTITESTNDYTVEPVVLPTGRNAALRQR